MSDEFETELKNLGTVNEAKYKEFYSIVKVSE